MGQQKIFFFKKKNLFLHKFLNEDFSRKHCISPSSACKTLKFQCSNSHIYSNFLSSQTGRKKIPTMHFPESPNNKKTQDSKPQSLHFLHSPTSQTDKGNPNSRRSEEGERKKPNKPLSSSSQTKTPHSNSQLLSIFLTFSNQPNRFKKTPIL